MVTSVARAGVHAFIDRWVATDTNALVDQTADLKVGADLCDLDQAKAAYHRTFDVWNRVQLLRFGPLGNGDLAFRFQYWPERKGIIGRKLFELASASNAIILDPDAFSEVSVAARGLMSLDYLLFDPGVSKRIEADQRCRLLKAIATDLVISSEELRHLWQSDTYANYRSRSPESMLSEDELLTVLYQALDTSLQYDIDLRLGAPLGSYTRAFPRKAEAWRSDRSLRNLKNSLRQSKQIALFLADSAGSKRNEIENMYGDVEATSTRLKHGLMAVDQPGYRLKAEMVQQKIQRIRDYIRSVIGPKLGVQQGFNSLDGD